MIKMIKKFEVITLEMLLLVLLMTLALMYMCATVVSFCSDTIKDGNSRRNDEEKYPLMDDK